MATGTDTQSPALQVADSHDLIRVLGARVNNLKDVSVELPKRRPSVFTGVSESGKSSLVFGILVLPRPWFEHRGGQGRRPGYSVRLRTTCG
jgi:hypothetical protein